ncbi:serine/threonine-protein kinase [Serinicoccus marinus]|uniref:serine/threonine-protein kinase n=1 Tax=Serinicoccus marinus TaxID=247333 RepID=UPI0024929710|nr:serine/threonine-protein kinase [Serinicoccus marinus]
MGEVLGGRYELVDPLGEGGAGVVWRAWDQREERYVAAKVLRQSDAPTLLRFVREQAVRVEHPHVLTPLGWAGDDDRVLIAMPLVRGGSVATLVGDHGPLPTVWVATLLDQLLDALARIHGEGLVHRDVKPANLLLDATGSGLPRLRLADFGIVTGVDDPRLTHVHHAVGTVGYAAPETLRVGWDPDPRADLYAAGLSAAELLLAQRPDADTVGPLADLLVRQGVDSGLVAVVLDLAAAEPEERYADASAAREALRATGLVASPETWDAGEVEVFDQVPELPAGWGAAGPEEGQTGPTSRFGPTDLGPVAQEATSSTEGGGAGAGSRLGMALLGLGLLLVLTAGLLALLS